MRLASSVYRLVLREMGYQQPAFTQRQLTRPEIAEAERILRTCMNYGFCTTTCLTYFFDTRTIPRATTRRRPELI